MRPFFLEEVALVRFSRNHPLPAFHGIVERLRVIGSELLDGAKPQGIGVLGNSLEYEVHRLFIDGVGDLFFPARKTRDVVIVHRFAAAHAKEALAGRFVAAGIEANCADMRQMHERRRKVIGRFGIEAPQSPDNCGRQALCGHIAPVFILELGLILAAMAEEHEHRPHDNADGNNQAHHNEEKRLQAGGVRLVRKLGLVFEHGVESIAHMFVGCRARYVHPFRREYRVDFGIAACAHRRNLRVNRAIIANRQASIKRAVAPRAHVVARANLRACRNRNRERRGYMIAIDRPTMADILPIHLGDVVVNLNEIRNGVREGHRDFRIGFIEEHIHGVLVLVDGIRRVSRAASLAPRTLKFYGGKRLGLTRRLIGERHRFHRKHAFLGRHVVEGPPHRREIAGEIECARFGDIKRAVCVRLGVYRDAWACVRFGVRVRWRACKHDNGSGHDNEELHNEGTCKAFLRSSVVIQR